MIKSLCGFMLSLFRRDGLASIGKVFRYVFSIRAWLWLITGIRNKRLLKAAGLVDEAWYRREYPDVVDKGVDPVQDFLTPPHPCTRLPNPDFIPGEYAAENLDLKASGTIWAVHYAQHGMREGRSVSTLKNFEKPFPPGAIELRRELPAAPVVHRRSAIFASFSGDGRIKDTVLYYLRELRKIADNIVFISNSPVFPDEAKKLDGLVRLALFRHHGCYDFGSYRIGWNEAKALGLLEPGICDELVMCNDSCVGPVFPFREVFAEMSKRKGEDGRRADFWGMSVVRQYGRRMIPSYFYVFGPAVLEGSELDRWIEGMEPCRNRGQVILRCESMLTEHLLKFGYSCAGIVPESFQIEHKATPIKFPLTTLRDYHDPLVKIKALRGDSLENLDDVHSFIQRTNPELAAIVPRFPQDAARSGMDIARAARENHEASLKETADLLRSLAASGKAVETILLSLSGEEAWIRPLCAALQHSGSFAASVAAVPDVRVPVEPERLSRLRAARARLSAALPGTRTLAVRTDADGEWLDVLPGSGIVFYPSASDWSDFRYNPHYAVGRSVLPILVFDRSACPDHPLEKEFARQNYAYFWKVFFADRESFDLYAKHSLRKGANAVLAEGGDIAETCIRSFRKALFH